MAGERSGRETDRVVVLPSSLEDPNKTPPRDISGYSLIHLRLDPGFLYGLVIAYY
jgi:hypothetical protein